MLRDELEPDPAALLVDLLDDDVEHVAAAITSSMWPTRPGPTFETCRSPSVPFFSSTKAPKSVVFTTLPVYVSPTSGSFVSDSIASIAAFAFVAVGRVDEDRAVLLDVDLHLVVAPRASGSSRRPCR